MRPAPPWLALLLLVAPAAAAAEPPPPDGGWAVHCAPCHGPTGRGDGPEAPLFRPRPRNLRDGLLDRYDTDALVRTVRDGAPLALALDPAALRARAGEAEALVAHLQRLPEVDWQRLERGEDLFAARCERCHALGAGSSGDAPDLTDASRRRGMSEEELRARLRHARPGMPVVPPLADPGEVEAVAAYVRELSPGFVLWARFCAACHGRDGRGDELVDPGRAPRVVFDRAYLAGRDPEALRTRVWHMLAEQRPAMPHFRRRLDEAQVRAIVEWLRRAE